MRDQWTRLTNGEPTPEFVAQVKRLLEAPRRPGAGQKSSSSAIATEDQEVRERRAEGGGREADDGWRTRTAEGTALSVARCVGLVNVRGSRHVYPW